ncbi:MAG: flavodoxin [Christensenellales bacterium]|jgi:flavodoxin I
MTTAIIYWSGTGNTEAMAKAIESGMKEAGAQTALFSVEEVTPAVVDEYEKFAFGCPSMGSEELEQVKFEPFFAAIESRLSGKKVALFGSYGWGDGEWMRDWVERANAAGALVYGEGLIQELEPDEDACREFGKGFAGF